MSNSKVQASQMIYFLGNGKLESYSILDRGWVIAKDNESYLIDLLRYL